jgi:hypothetical protein
MQARCLNELRLVSFPEPLDERCPRDRGEEHERQQLEDPCNPLIRGPHHEPGAERMQPCASSSWTDAMSPGEPEKITVGTGVSPGARSNLEARDDRYEQAAAIIFTDFTPR